MVWPYLTRRDIAGIGLVILFFAGPATTFLLQPQFFWQASRGFDPGWDCTYPGKGEPICVKRVAPAKNPQQGTSFRSEMARSG